jgi:hypothetical protein
LAKYENISIYADSTIPKLSRQLDLKTNINFYVYGNGYNEIYTSQALDFIVASGKIKINNDYLSFKEKDYCLIGFDSITYKSQEITSSDYLWKPRKGNNSTLQNIDVTNYSEIITKKFKNWKEIENISL